MMTTMDKPKAETKYKVTPPESIQLKYAAGMIVLNEEQFVGDWLATHYEMFDRIVIVEGADPYYPRDAVSDNGLSLDKTAEIIREFPDPDNKITLIQHGWTSPPVENPSSETPGYREGEGKCLLRDRYAQVLNSEKFDGIFIQVDADEFYPREIQDDLKMSVAEVIARNMNPRLDVTYWTEDGYVLADEDSEVAKAALAKADEGGLIGGDPTVPAKIETEYPAGKIHGFRFPTVHLWHDMETAIVGGYYDIEHTRVFRWRVGSRYEWRGLKSHNWPISPDDKPLMRHGSHQVTRTFDVIPKDGADVAERLDQVAGIAHSKPYCLHLGFTRPGDELRDRNEYYKARGESKSRPDTIADRESWFVSPDEAAELMADRGLSVFKWLGHNPLEALSGV